MCEGDRNAGVGDLGGVVVMSAGNEYVGGTRDSGIVFIRKNNYIQIYWMIAYQS